MYAQKQKWAPSWMSLLSRLPKKLQEQENQVSNKTYNSKRGCSSYSLDSRYCHPKVSTRPDYWPISFLFKKSKGNLWILPLVRNLFPSSCLRTQKKDTWRIQEVKRKQEVDKEAYPFLKKPVKAIVTIQLEKHNHLKSSQITPTWGWQVINSLVAWSYYFL